MTTKELKKWRAGLDINQSAAAKLFGVSREQYNRWENGAPMPQMAVNLFAYLQTYYSVLVPTKGIGVYTQMIGRIKRADKEISTK